jgi:hypothetical protein
MSYPSVANWRSTKAPDSNPRRRSEILRVIQLDLTRPQILVIPNGAESPGGTCSPSDRHQTPDQSPSRPVILRQRSPRLSQDCQRRIYATGRQRRHRIIRGQTKHSLFPVSLCIQHSPPTAASPETRSSTPSLRPTLFVPIFRHSPKPIPLSHLPPTNYSFKVVFRLFRDFHSVPVKLHLCSNWNTQAIIRLGKPEARSRRAEAGSRKPKSTHPAGIHLPPAKKFPRQNILRRCDAIPDHAPRAKSIASPPGTARQ